MKVDTYLLGHWPSERERLHIGAVAPVEYNLKDQAPGRAASATEPRLASSWHVGAVHLAASDVCRWLSLASSEVDWR